MGNDGGKVIKILEVHENGKPSVSYQIFFCHVIPFFTVRCGT